jgi:hypothetical protein
VLLATNLTTGQTSIIIAIIGLLGLLGVALIQVYRRSGDIATKVNGQLTTALAQWKIAVDEKQVLAVENAVLKERLRTQGGHGETPG